jgi:hypothetical protein
MSKTTEDRVLAGIIAGMVERGDVEPTYADDPRLAKAIRRSGHYQMMLLDARCRELGRALMASLPEPLRRAMGLPDA